MGIIFMKRGKSNTGLCRDCFFRFHRNRNDRGRANTGVRPYGGMVLRGRINPPLRGSVFFIKRAILELPLRGGEIKHRWIFYAKRANGRSPLQGGWIFISV